MKTFECFEKVSCMSKCRKHSIIIHAKQINEDFRVCSLEGDYIQGKAGDYLVKGIKGELYICDKDIFEKTYEWIEDKGSEKMNEKEINEYRKEMFVLEEKYIQGEISFEKLGREMKRIEEKYNK